MSPILGPELRLGATSRPTVSPTGPRRASHRSPTDRQRQHCRRPKNRISLPMGRQILHPQDDEEDKRRQIRLMAGIYGSAQMTIIAAAGSDPRYGLPGVSRPLEIRRPHARVGNRTLTWTFGSGSLRDDVSASVWSTRGWTYQEDILSARRLVFTEQQVYFQCGLSGYYQAFNVHARLMGSVGEDKILARMKSNVLPHHVGDRIHEYTHRKLGNEDDILNAFQGHIQFNCNTQLFTVTPSLVLHPLYCDFQLFTVTPSLLLHEVVSVLPSLL